MYRPASGRSPASIVLGDRDGDHVGIAATGRVDHSRPDGSRCDRFGAFGVSDPLLGSWPFGAMGAKRNAASKLRRICAIVLVWLVMMQLYVTMYGIADLVVGTISAYESPTPKLVRAGPYGPYDLASQDER